MKSTLRFLMAEIPLFPVPVRLQSSTSGAVDFWWSRISPEIDISASGLIYRGGERGDLEFLKRFLTDGMTYYDVGAFHGLYAVVAGRCVGRRGQVVLFEPSSAACRRARINLFLNGVNALVENVAVFESDGTVEFHEVLSGFRTMSALRKPASNAPARIREVTAVSLDNYCSKQTCRRLDLMKIDIEGAELGAFRGASYVLDQLRPVIICEVLDWVTEPWGYEARDIINALASHGYQWFDIDKDGILSKHTTRDSYPDLCNYIAIPSERVDTVIERSSRL